MDCFKEYCQTKLTSRQFIQKPSIGYTLLCPNHCEGSEVREMHHFRMLGKELVSVCTYTSTIESHDYAPLAHKPPLHFKLKFLHR